MLRVRTAIRVRQQGQARRLRSSTRNVSQRRAPGTQPALAPAKAGRKQMNVQQFPDTLRHFVDDDPGYLRWLTHHPAAFVLNTTRTPSAAYLMLHRANCWTITRLQPRATTFTGDYSKLCGGRDELEARARRLSGTAKACGHCL
jgi:hypothetical protein